MKKTPSVQQFKRLVREAAPLAEAMIVAREFAKTERARVDAYIDPLLASLKIQYRGGLNVSGTITNHNHLYLTDDPRCQEGGEVWKLFDAAHREHGFTGEFGYCPALVAEDDARKAEHAYLAATGAHFGVEACDLYGNNRKEFLDLMLGATRLFWKERAAVGALAKSVEAAVLSEIGVTRVEP